ncbi:hypothetical protein [Planococcus alpniumensis]|uniref:hypothetical protein n=1 Tax=Planococcus alpniumensis TaxID=2708345 RepID=UPI001B8BE484|nr:hypothetical protein [Planococcus sp. MSAK28401]
MQLETIQNLLQISCHFNTSSITHSFVVNQGESLTVRCLKDTFVLEITSSKTQQKKQYLSVEQASTEIFEQTQAS